MNRRDFIRHVGAGTTAALGSRLFSADAPSAAIPSAPPRFKNVLLLFSDQHRADCLGCYGNPLVRTPNLDRLARDGIRFTQAFTPTATCSPARASLLTGLWAHQHGLQHVPAYAGFAGGRSAFDPARWPMYANTLREKNYQRAHIGKWHIGDTTGPADCGFEGLHYPGYGYPHQHPHYLQYLRRLGVDGFRLSEVKKKRFEYAGLLDGPEEALETHYLAAQTVETIERYAQSDRPFFVSCNFWGPHAPHFLPEKYFRMYDGVPIPAWRNFRCSLDDKPEIYRRYGQYWGTQDFTEEKLSRLLATYFGYITAVDDAIGQIVAALERSGKLDETLIVYSTDHGSTEGSYGMWDKGFGMFDCTQRIPFILSHSSLRGRRAVSDEFVTLLDLAPTFIDCAGGEVPAAMSGRTLLPLVRNPAQPRQRDHVICESFGHQMTFWQRMVRTDTAKYVFNPTSIDEFYDLAADPDETVNLITRTSVAQLAPFKERLDQWMQATRDPLLEWSGSTLR